MTAVILLGAAYWTKRGTRELSATGVASDAVSCPDVIVSAVVESAADEMEFFHPRIEVVVVNIGAKSIVIDGKPELSLGGRYYSSGGSKAVSEPTRPSWLQRLFGEPTISIPEVPLLEVYGGWSMNVGERLKAVASPGELRQGQCAMFVWYPETPFQEKVPDEVVANISVFYSDKDGKHSTAVSRHFCYRDRATGHASSRSER